MPLFEQAERVRYKKEFDAAVRGLGQGEMHSRGIIVLSGLRRQLRHRLDAAWHKCSRPRAFCPSSGAHDGEVHHHCHRGRRVAKLLMKKDELGEVKPGYLADCILDPLADISIS